MSSPVYVVTYFKPLPDKKDSVIEGMKEMAANVEQSEPGAHVYEVFWNEEDGVVAVMQKYADAAAAEAHRNSPHLKEAMQRSGSDLEMQPQTKVMTKLAGFARQG